MSQPEQFLMLFSLLLIASLVCAVLLPYLRGRTDLVTGLNVFLVGAMVFVGLSGIDAATQGWHYGQYDDDVYLLYAFGNFLFYTVLLLSYHKLRIGRWIGSRVMRTWPPLNFFAVIFAIAICAAVYVISGLGLPVFSAIARMMGLTSLGFAVGIAFAGWQHQKLNPLYFIVLCATLAAALLLAVLMGGGRRPFLSVLVAAPVLLYWFRFRYRSRVYNLTAMATVGVGVFLVLGAYSMTRWFDLGREGVERNVATSVQQLSNTVNNLGNVDLANSFLKLGQNAAEVTLLSIHRSKDVDPYPFHTVVYVFSNPIPRSAWRDKPVAYGQMILQARFPNTPGNWGPTFVGHSYFEGGYSLGLVFVILYAVITGILLRTIDEALATQSTNPYIISLFAASIAYILAWPRGDIGVVSLSLIGCVLLAIIIRVLGAFFFGGVYVPRPQPQWPQAGMHAGPAPRVLREPYPYARGG